MEHDLTEKRARPVRTRFELAIGRILDAWISARRIDITAEDVKLACDFLVEETGCRVEPGADTRLLVVHREGRATEMTREMAVLTALRRLATRR